MSRSPLNTLNNGVRKPAVRFVTLSRSAVEQAVSAVHCAIANGYRLIDTVASCGVSLTSMSSTLGWL
jgi:diketogulonate reductase-like aldo/keto reductase